jgi:hypothetical protein
MKALSTLQFTSKKNVTTLANLDIGENKNLVYVGYTDLGLLSAQFVNKI